MLVLKQHILDYTIITNSVQWKRILILISDQGKLKKKVNEIKYTHTQATDLTDSSYALQLHLSILK